jgi:hypothetical protein
MQTPRPQDVAHDLRNLVGLVRALSAELGPLVADASDDVRTVSADLERYSRFSMDALRVLEKWDSSDTVEIQIGAWAWALRLNARELVVGDLSTAGRVSVVVPRAIEAGVALVQAIGGTRAVGVESDGTGVVFERIGRAHDPDALATALSKLKELGLAVNELSAMPCRIRVGG